MKKERVNRLDVTFTQEECEVLEKCADILHEMANSTSDEGVTTLTCDFRKFDVRAWLKEVGDVLEYFSTIETVSITG